MNINKRRFVALKQLTPNTEIILIRLVCAGPKKFQRKMNEQRGKSKEVRGKEERGSGRRSALPLPLRSYLLPLCSYPFALCRFTPTANARKIRSHAVRF